MCAAIVGAPPFGSLAMEKTTFSPFCATGNGANGSGGRELQNRPPQACAGSGFPTSVRQASPAATTASIILDTTLFKPRRAFLMALSSFSPGGSADDPDPLVVRVGDIDLAGGTDLDAGRAIEQRRGGGAVVAGEPAMAALAREGGDDPVGRHHADAAVVGVRD